MSHDDLSERVNNNVSHLDGDAIPRNRDRAMRRRPRWRTIAAYFVISSSAAWGLGYALSRQIERLDIEAASEHPEPLPEFPTPSLVEDNNNAIMRNGFVGDLDGTAIAYDAEADGLVAGDDGHFETDLTLEQVAKVLKIDIATISRRDDPHEIDPDAVLFKAQSGRLSETGKAISRRLRNQQARAGRGPSAVYGDWITQEFSFTLNRLKRPSEGEKAVLAAISRAARSMMPQLGEKIRAIGVNRGAVESVTYCFAPSMLPLEKRQNAAAYIKSHAIQ